VTIRVNSIPKRGRAALYPGGLEWGGSSRAAAAVRVTDAAASAM